MSDEIKKIDEISETQNAPEIKKEKKKLSKKAKKIIFFLLRLLSQACVRSIHIAKRRIIRWLQQQMMLLLWLIVV